MVEPIRVLIAASGSGGHLFPAVFIAEAIREIATGSVVEFFGTGRPLEESIVGRRGYRRHVVPFQGLKGRGVLGLVQALRQYPRAISATAQVVREFAPHVVVGVGGYASVLPVLVAWWRGVPSWLHEAEFAPGAANRALFPLVTGASVAWSECRLRGEKVIHSGHPLRREIAEAAKRAAGYTPRKRILVLGGSQGADALDRAVAELLPRLSQAGFEVRAQCRERNIERMREAFAAAKIRGEVVAFIDDMATAYQWADIVISRAGAGSVVELATMNVPSILVPLPNSIGGHQEANARAMERAKRSVVVLEGENFAARLGAEITHCFNPAVYRAMLQDPDPLHVNASRVIAEQIVRLAHRKP